jgi:uncharacterized protein (TIGR02145 family)
MKKRIIFLAVFIFMATVSHVSAQEVLLPNDELTLGYAPSAENPGTRATDFDLGYSQNGTSTAAGWTISTSCYYMSGCIYFSKAQMSDYVGKTMKGFKIRFPSATWVPELGSYSFWIKNTITGAIVYEQSIPVENIVYNTVNSFQLTTPYTITDNSLVLGITGGFPATATGAQYPLSYETQYSPYSTSAYNQGYSALPTAHGTSSFLWNTNSGRALNVWGVIGDLLPANDMSASSVETNTLKWVGGTHPCSVDITNEGTASQNSYTVQLLDASNNVLGSQAFTTPLAAGASTSVIVNCTPAATGNIPVNCTPEAPGNIAVRGKVILAGDEDSGNDITPPVTFRIYPYQPVGYCSNDTISGLGDNNANRTYSAAIDYPVSNMAPFVGKVLTAMEIGINDVPSNLTGCSIWVRNSLTGTDIYNQPFTPVQQGWNTIPLTTPFEFPNEDIYIGYTFTTTAGSYPLGRTTNTQNAAHGGHFTTSGNTWTTMALNDGNTPVAGNLAIIGVVAEIPTKTVTASVAPVNAGTVSGSNTYNCGAEATVTATPGACYTFTNWTVNGTPVSTDNPYTFTVTQDSAWVANFELKTLITQIADTITMGDTYIFFDTLLTTADIYNYTLPSIHGCDSIIELALTVLPAPFIVEAIASANGTISNSGLNSVFYGHNITFTFTPDVGNHIASVLIDGVPNLAAVASGSYTFNHVNSNHIIEVVFEVVFIAGCPGVVTDNEGNPYTVTPLVGLCWTSNMRNRTYNDSAATPIPFAGAYYHELNPDSLQYIENYGLLYTYGSVFSGTRFCPVGWRIPTSDEFSLLNRYAVEELKHSGDFWVTPNTNSNTTGFDSRGAGYYNSRTERFENLNAYAMYWTSDAPKSTTCAAGCLRYNCNQVEIVELNPTDAISVRCVKE